MRRFFTTLLIVMVIPPILVSLGGCESARELFYLLIPLEQTVSRDELAQRYYTRTVSEVWYCGSDEKYDYFTLFGQRYAVLRSEECLPGNLRFPMDEKRSKLPLYPHPISGVFYPTTEGE